MNARPERPDRPESAELQAAVDAAALAYARVLALGAHLGLALLLLTFAYYVSGLGQPLLPLQQLPELWTRSAAEVLRSSGMGGGWSWVAHVAHGDIAGLAGIAVLAACPLPALLLLAWRYGRRGERLQAALCLAQLAVLLLAASGWWNRGP